MSVNSVLFQSNYGLREPALLSVGRTTANNYDGLAAYLAQQTPSAEAAAVTDKVDLALDKVKGKLISELAAITADAIADNPDMADDYVLAVVGSGSGREVRVWSRAEIIAAIGGDEEDREKLRQELENNPLVAFESAEGLPPTSQNSWAADLAGRATDFLRTNDKLLGVLGKYGCDPFEALIGA
jgi:hypothetical protein